MRFGAGCSVAVLSLAGMLQAGTRVVTRAVDGSALEERRQAGWEIAGRLEALGAWRGGGRARVDVRENGTLSVAAGFASRSYFGTATQAAEAFLAESGVLEASGWAPQLRPEREAAIGLDRFAEFQQTVDGVPVYGRRARVLVDGLRRVHAVYARLARGGAPAGAVWTLDEEAALERARGAVGRAAVEKLTAERVWFEQDGQLQPAWSLIVLGPAMSGSWAVLVGAEDGQVLAQKRLETYFGRSGKGNAYADNPVTSQLAEMPLDHLQSYTYLFGDNVRVYNYTKARLGLAKVGILEAMAVADANGNYLYKPFGSDTRFSEVQLYSVADRVADAFRWMGWPGFSAPLKAAAHWADCSDPGLCTTEVNAYFTPVGWSGGPGLFMYHVDGGIDTSYDGDVVAHEMTHAVVSSLVGVGLTSDDFDAINEGTADYFSSSLLGNAPVGEFFAQLARMRSNYLRTPENHNSYPRNLSGEAHRDGNIWSGLLWDMRSALGAEDANRVTLYALVALGLGGDFYDAGWALSDAAGYLLGGEAGLKVEELARARGVLSEAARMAGSARGLTYSKLPLIDGIAAASDETGAFCARQVVFYVPPGLSRVALQIEGTSEVEALVKHRSPVEVREDGSTNAEYRTERGKTFTLRLDSDSDPEIQAGYYYVWVSHFNTESRTQFSLKLVAYSASSDVSQLRYSDLMLDGPEATGAVSAGEWLNSRQFRLVVPEGTAGAELRLEGDRDVDLYLRFNAPVGIGDQGNTEGDVAVASDGKTEVVQLNSRTIPNLRPGSWSVGVVNFDPDGVAHFKLKAVALPEQPAATVLTNAKPDTEYTVKLPAAHGVPLLAVDQFVIPVSLWVKKFRVEVLTSGADVQVSLRKDRAVEVQGGKVVADQTFRVKQNPSFEMTDSELTPLQSGNWYLGFSNLSGEAAEVKFKLVLQ